MKTFHLFISLIVVAMILTLNIVAEPPPIYSLRTIFVVFCAAFGFTTLVAWVICLVCAVIGFLISIYQCICAANNEPDEPADSEFDEVERSLKTENSEPRTEN